MPVYSLPSEGPKEPCLPSTIMRHPHLAHAIRHTPYLSKPDMRPAMPIADTHADKCETFSETWQPLPQNRETVEPVCRDVVSEIVRAVISTSLHPINQFFPLPCRQHHRDADESGRKERQNREGISRIDQRVRTPPSSPGLWQSTRSKSSFRFPVQVFLLSYPSSRSSSAILVRVCLEV